MLESVRRRPAPELIIMGLLAALCGVALALLMSATLGIRSSGPPAALKTVTTPSADIAKLRETAARSARIRQARERRAARRAASLRAAPVVSAPAVAQLPTPPVQTYTNQPSSQPVQRYTPPPTPVRSLPRPVRPAPRPKPTGGGGGSFDDSG